MVGLTITTKGDRRNNDDASRLREALVTITDKLGPVIKALHECPMSCREQEMYLKHIKLIAEIALSGGQDENDTTL